MWVIYGLVVVVVAMVGAIIALRVASIPVTGDELQPVSLECSPTHRRLVVLVHGIAGHADSPWRV
jgi:hypothetical protein